METAPAFRIETLALDAPGARQDPRALAFFAFRHAQFLAHFGTTSYTAEGIEKDFLPHTRAYVAYAPDGRIVGGCVSHLRLAGEAPNLRVEELIDLPAVLGHLPLAALNVGEWKAMCRDESYQSKGVYAALMDCMTGELKRQGADVMLATLSPNNVCPSSDYFRPRMEQDALLFLEKPPQHMEGSSKVPLVLFAASFQPEKVTLHTPEMKARGIGKPPDIVRLQQAIAPPPPDRSVQP